MQLQISICYEIHTTQERAHTQTTIYWIVYNKTYGSVLITYALQYTQNPLGPTFLTVAPHSQCDLFDTQVGPTRDSPKN